MKIRLDLLPYFLLGIKFFLGFTYNNTNRKGRGTVLTFLFKLYLTWNQLLPFSLAPKLKKNNIRFSFYLDWGRGCSYRIIFIYSEKIHETN